MIFTIIFAQKNMKFMKILDNNIIIRQSFLSHKKIYERHSMRGLDGMHSSKSRYHSGFKPLCKLYIGQCLSD